MIFIVVFVGFGFGVFVGEGVVGLVGCFFRLIDGVDFGLGCFDV